MYHEIKSLITYKNLVFQKKNSNKLDCNVLHELSPESSNSVPSSILQYHRQLAIKRNDPKTAPEFY